ncbi:hypothetical protein BH11ACT6_BH11ACT6_34590 [soil metagenome]
MPALHRHTAYRRGLCVACQRVKPAAGMPRCLPCHSANTGYRLTPEQRRQHTLYLMAGGHPDPELYAVARVVTQILSAPVAT